MKKIIIIIIICDVFIPVVTDSLRRSQSDIKSPQRPKTLLSIRVDLSSAVV